MPIVTTETQVAIRYGDGMTEHAFDTVEDAWQHVKELRIGIAEGDLEADDYEPMTVMSRVVVTTQEIGKWVERAPVPVMEA